MTTQFSALILFHKNIHFTQCIKTTKKKVLISIHENFSLVNNLEQNIRIDLQFFTFVAFFQNKSEEESENNKLCADEA
jgi:hypothetical protein